MKLSECETITDEAKFLETHKLRSSLIGKLYDPFRERKEKYEKQILRQNDKGKTETKA